MILIDDRVGSRHLLPLLHSLGLPAKLSRLKFADAAWFGRGPEGMLKIGVEVKRIDDLIQSMVSKRLTAHQLPGLVRAYQSRWLLVQGGYKASRDGMIQKHITRPGLDMWVGQRGGLSWEALEGALVTFRMLGGLQVAHTLDDASTARWLGLAYRWWQRPWTSHRAHLAVVEEFAGQMDTNLDPRVGRKRLFAERVAAQIDGVGVDKARRVLAYLPTVFHMVQATTTDWMKIPGIGKSIAKEAWESFRRVK